MTGASGRCRLISNWGTQGSQTHRATSLMPRSTAAPTPPASFSKLSRFSMRGSMALAASLPWRIPCTSGTVSEAEQGIRSSNQHVGACHPCAASTDIWPSGWSLVSSRASGQLI